MLCCWSLQVHVSKYEAANDQSFFSLQVSLSGKKHMVRILNVLVVYQGLLFRTALPSSSSRPFFPAVHLGDS